MTTAGPITIGIDLGGTNAQLGVVDASHRIILRTGIKTQADDGCDVVLDRLAAGAAEICQQASVERDAIAAIGIAAPGAIDMPRGVVLEAPNLGWRNVPVRDLLEKRIGRPVVVDNDVNAAAWGEYRLGAAKQCRDCLAVWLGTGVGGGLIFNGRLHHGSLFTAGEFGQQTILPDEPRGSRIIEDHCSRTGMSRLIRQWSEQFPDSSIGATGQPAGHITTNAELTRAWQNGDALAAKVVEHAAHWLGVGIANAITLLAVECVVIGGGVTESLGQPLLDLIRQSFDRHVFPDANRACKLVLTELREDAGLLGAAILARDGVSARDAQPESV